MTRTKLVHPSMSIALLLLLVAALQLQAPGRAEAEALARAGHNAEAFELFARIVEQNPDDAGARLWKARLALRLGRLDEAEAEFRIVRTGHPDDLDALVGLASTLLRKGDWRTALAMLRDAEPAAGENADLLGALARASRRAGDDRAALEYFRRAKALAPDDPDLAAGFEAAARVYGHTLVFEGIGRRGVGGGPALASGALEARVRAAPRLHLLGFTRVQQQGGDYTDAIAGGGIAWRLPRATSLDLSVRGGPENAALPLLDVSADVMRYGAVFEGGVGVRRLSFAGSDLLAVSPAFGWDDGTWRFDVRYTYSRSRFAAADAAGDHSILLRDTWRLSHRAAVTGLVAYGIESFETLTADRVGALGASTAGAGLRLALPSLAAITASWEHQWRSDDAQVDRVTVTFAQSFP